MKYQVVSRVTAPDEAIKQRELHKYFAFEEPNLIAYKIIAGLYIFYISKETYIKGVEQGVVEPITSEISNYPYEQMLMCRGDIVNHRMPYALKHSTVEYLTECLEKVKANPKILTVKVYKAQWEDYKQQFEEGYNPTLNYLEEVKVDMEKQTIFCINLNHESSKYRIVSVFKGVKTYADVLDRLVLFLDREYMNSRNIYDKYKENDFYDVDWHMQKRFKFKFIFE